MTQYRSVTGDPDCVAQELTALTAEGWEIVHISTNLYESTAGVRTEATVFLKKMIQA